MASIVNATWPYTADATHLPHVLTAALDEQHAAQQQAAESVGGKPPHRGSRHPSLWSTEPRSSAATAALLTIAHTHLRQPVQQLRETLTSLLEHAPETPDRRWGATRVTLQRDASPLIRHEIDNAFRRRFPAQHPPGSSDQADRTACVIPVRAPGYQAENIPQHLPDEWFTLLSQASRPKFLPRSPQTNGLRRAAAVQLVQAVTGMRMDEAARFQKKPYDLAGALEQLAEHIAALPQQVDYRQLRESFQPWNLSTATWNKICRTVPTTRIVRSDDQFREYSSAFVWSLLTGSEWKLAPCFLPPHSPEGRTFTQQDSKIIQRLSCPPDRTWKAVADLLRQAAHRNLASWERRHQQRRSVSS